MFISVTSWIIVGAIAGWLASLLMGRDMRGGCCGLVLLGMLGAVLGGIVFRLAGGAPITGVNIYSIVVAVVGSLILIALARAARGHGR